MRHLVGRLTSDDRLGGLVDPGDGGQLGGLGWVADEAFGVGGVGGVEDGLAVGADSWSSAVVDVGGGGEADSGVAGRRAVLAGRTGAQSGGGRAGPPHGPGMGYGAFGVSVCVPLRAVF